MKKIEEQLAPSEEGVAMKEENINYVWLNFKLHAEEENCREIQREKGLETPEGGGVQEFEDFVPWGLSMKCSIL